MRNHLFVGLFVMTAFNSGCDLPSPFNSHEDAWKDSAASEEKGQGSRSAQQPSSIEGTLLGENWLGQKAYLVPVSEDQIRLDVFDQNGPDGCGVDNGQSFYTFKNSKQAEEAEIKISILIPISSTQELDLAKAEGSFSSQTQDGKLTVPAKSATIEFIGSEDGIAGTLDMVSEDGQSSVRGKFLAAECVEE